MGATASLIENMDTTVPNEIKTLLDVCDRQKAKIYESESDLLDKEKSKMFKNHNDIIDRLTGHSKSQLHKLFTNHASALRTLEDLMASGNHYAKFIRQLPKSKEELEWEAITTSSKPDYDEELLVEMIGCSTTDEIQRLDQIFLKEKTFCLADLFATHAKSDSQLKHFLERILRFDRDESKTVDNALAVKQAAIIHKAGAARLYGVDEEPIMDILSTASRAQCAAINEMYIENYKMKLERAINMKFKGNCGKLLVLWTQPLAAAIVTCAHYISQKMLVDKNALMNFIAKYEKDVLATADEASKAAHKKSLAELIGAKSGGTFQRALKGWIELPSPDKGFERILDLYLKSRMDKGVTMEEMLADHELRSKIHFLIEKQAQEMKLYMIDHKVKLDPADQAILARSFQTNVKRSNTEGIKSAESSSTNVRSPTAAAVSKAPSFDDEQDVTVIAVGSHTVTPTLKAIPELKALEAKRMSVVHNVSADVHEKQSKKVYHYLIEVLEHADKQSEGSLEVTQFWNALESMPLDELGFTQSELDVIRQYSQWESEDGRIYYYEVIFEFCDSVIASIENKPSGDTDVISVISHLQAQQKHQTPAVKTSNKFLTPKKSARLRLDIADESVRKGSVFQYPNIPIFFRQYLMDTLTAFDLDCNGYLTEKELQTLLEVINIPDLTMKHLMEDGIDYITPKEASDAILGVTEPYFTDGTEHYICLVDRDSGAYFWYNTLDGTTQWADASYADQPAPAAVAAAQEDDQSDFGEADPATGDAPKAAEARANSPALEPEPVFAYDGAEAEQMAEGKTSDEICEEKASAKDVEEYEGAVEEAKGDPEDEEDPAMRKRSMTVPDLAPVSANEDDQPAPASQKVLKTSQSAASVLATETPEES